MCGIIGFCDTRNDGDRSHREQLPIAHSMMDTIRHRGPDGDGTYVDEHACLGHVRLRILDLSDNARQPMASPDGRTLLTFNGEIYNFRALRSELEPEYPFRSNSDTEVLLAGYEKWGNDVFRRANGMFAAAFWNTHERRLVLARDRLGKKPLFYYWDGTGRVVFSSELKALLRHPAVPRKLDQHSLALYFTFGYVPTPRTIFEHIYKVPQGSIVTFDDGRRTITPYWELPADEVRIREDDALDELDALLRDAVKIRLESDVPVGFFLSGGLDSSLVTAIGQKLVGNARTFTVGFEEASHDESEHARQIAEHLGTRHTSVRINNDDFAAFIASAPKYYDEPFADSSLIATYYVARTTREYVTVALSGDGGDELFCGYPKYMNLRTMLPAMRLPASLRVASGRLLQRIPINASRKIGHAMQTGSVEELVRWLVSVWKSDELTALMPHSITNWNDTAVAKTWLEFQHRDHISRFMAADIKSFLCDDILQKVDRASMAVALEIRCPLLDYRVVELAMRLPLSLKYRAGQQKYLLRRLLDRYLPRHLWDGRPKHGLNVPVQSWYRMQRREPMVAAIRELGRRYDGVLSPTSMSHFMQQHLTGRYDYSHKLFALDALNHWAKEYQ